MKLRPFLFGSLLLSSTMLLSSLGMTPAVGQQHSPEIQQVEQNYLDKKEVAGVVTLVASDQGILHLHAAGSADLSRSAPMQTDSIFWIASMSKPVTGACMMILVDQGKVSLDDPITKYLPEMKDLKTKDGKTVNITIRHLLTHTSGMDELKPDEAYTSKNLTEAASRYAKVQVAFEPGTKWRYSQTSINTAARIIEVVSGKSFDTFVAEKIFQPLQMKDTTFYLSEQQASRLAKSYKKTNDGFEEAKIGLLAGKEPTFRDRMPAANGGLFSTANDFAQFCRMLLRNGELDGNRILSVEAVKTLRSIHSGDLETGFTPGNGWGIGCCVVKNPQGVTEALSSGSFGHGGAYGTQAWIDPVKNRIYLLMVQRSNFPNSDASDLRRDFQNAAVKAFPSK
ncbi:MAG: serine hydrolase domain-containing protein [Pirellulales bacterium]